MKTYFDSLKFRFKKTLESLFSGLASEFSNDNSLISDDVLKMIENPSDKKKIDEAVEFLLIHKSTKQTNVKLSNKTITISLG